MCQKSSKIGAVTGASLVIANMIGTGVFTSLGFQLVDLSNTAIILLLWIAGGIMALAGAFSYAEVGTSIRRSGGEYTFLTEIFNPLVGYLSGWISLTVGFAAPIALSAIAFTEYLPIPIAHARFVGVVLIFMLTMIHSLNLNVSAGFQNVMTSLKVLLIISIVVLGVILPAGSSNALNFDASFLSELKSPAFAISLIYVTYAYSGWNAAAYITGEFKNPRRSLPVALIGGTLIVTVLYTFIQYVFIKHAPYYALVGKLNVGTIAIEYMLGSCFAPLFSGAISLLLISGISAMVWVGPRVTSSIANDHPLWKIFRNNKQGIPVKALWLQAVLSAILLLTGTFDQILVYCGILLNLSALFSVIGVFVLRQKSKNITGQGNSYNYKSPLFPFFQFVFILFVFWIIGFSVVNKPIETLIGIVNLLIGSLTYFVSKRMR